MQMDELQRDFPHIKSYNGDPYIILNFFSLILDACNRTKDSDKQATVAKRAVRLFDILWSYSIRSIADFDCSRLKDLKELKGIGPVYKKVLTAMFQIRLEQICLVYKEGATNV